MSAPRAVSPPAATASDDDALGEGFSAQLDRALRAPLGRIIANADSINAQTDGPIRQDYVDYAADIASASLKARRGNPSSEVGFPSKSVQQ